MVLGQKILAPFLLSCVREMRLCRRGCATLPAILCLSLLTLLAIIYSSRRVNVRRSHLVSISDRIHGVAPAISDKDIPQRLYEDVHVATQTLPKNAEVYPLSHSRAGHNIIVNGYQLTRNVMSTKEESGPEFKPLSNLRTGIDRPRNTALRTHDIAPVLTGRGQVGRGREDPEMRRLQKMFPLSPYFSFPNPQITLPLSVIDNSQWMKKLRSHLSKLSGRKVINLVTSNIQYQDVLLNWLISAVVRSGLELDSVLVLVMEGALQTHLINRGIASVHVPLFALIHSETNFTKAFDKVMMLRLAVMRVINHWGFDVHNYDTDAVLLRNPQPLYDHLIRSDIIGSVGRIPDDLMMKWGITICIGVVIIRSNPRTEQYWQAISNTCLSSLDDQEKLNCGLNALNITWSNARTDHNETTVHGQCNNDLAVSVLPYQQICRLETCDPHKRNSYYIWHKGGSRNRREKLKGSRDGKTWFLRYKWSSIDNKLRGKEWLNSIAYWEVTHT